MTIVAGTDFSENSTRAANSAAAMARRLGTSLKLVHAVGSDSLLTPDQESVLSHARDLLREQADALRARHGIPVEPVALTGAAHEVLADVARTAGAQLVVVSSLGAKKQHRWLLGSEAERVAQTSPVPVLVARNAEALESWARGARALQVLVGVELTPVSKAALRWAVDLRAIGPCDLHVVHVAWPPWEHDRLGIRGSMPLDRLRPDVEQAVERDLREWAGDLPGEGKTRFLVRPGLGRVDTHLTLLAEDAQVDLIVVGTHQRSIVARAWLGSVSRGILHGASTNVTCVPSVEATEETIPSFRRVLVPTDFSPLSIRAIKTAYGLVGRGGLVHLVHVVTRESSANAVDAASHLRELVPEAAAVRGTETECEVVQDEHASRGILRAAERMNADAICMATHGHSGAVQLLLGSQAQGVVQQARRPVVLVPPERV